MRNARNARRRAALLAIGSGIFIAGARTDLASGASVSWNNAAGGNWTGPNWTGGVGTNPPTSADSARFIIPNTYTVTLDTNPTVTQTFFSGSNVSIANSTPGRTYTNTSTMFVNSGTFNLTATTPIAWTSNNTVNFNSTTNVTNGNDFSALILGVGTASSSTTTFSGAGTTLTVSGSTNIGLGVGTTGTLIFSNGASASLNGGVNMATLNSGVANMTVQTGATVSSNELKVATEEIATTATLIVTGSGTSLLQGGTGPLQVGAASLSQGNATFDSTATATLNFGMTVNATGVVTIQGGAVVNTSNVVELNSGTGNGADLFIDGTNSAMTQSGSFGTLTVGDATGNTSKVQLTNGGTYTTGTGTNTVNATGLIDIINGTFNANGNTTVQNGGLVQRGSSGSFNIAAGKTMTLQSGGDFSVAGNYTMNTTGAISITGAGSTMPVTGTLTIGGGGQISIASSGSLTANDERIGDASGSGSVTQSGGTHTISGGINPLRIASTTGSTGSYTLSGGTLSVVNNDLGSNGEAVGFNGTGTFTQTGGTHTVSGANGNLVIGYAATGVGTYTISNGTLTSNSLYLGRDAGAQGTLHINTGGIVNVATEFLDLGLNVGATGTVNVNTGGSITAQAMYIGGVSNQPRGTGVLFVNGGTATSNGELKVWDTTGTAVNLSSGTLTAASLNTSGNPSRFNWTGGTFNVTGAGGLSISASGPLGASLTLGATQTLNVTNTLNIASGASLTINGSTHTSGALTGSGALTINGGLTVGSANTSTSFTGTISGTGSLGKVGSGELTVNNLRLGGASITGGKLTVATNGSTTGTSRLDLLGIVSARLDLKDNDLIVTSMSYGVVEGLVKSGFGNFDWLGTGITSSVAAGYAQTDGSRTLGVIDNSQWGHGSFGGLTVNSSDILVKFTWAGDANVDGIVDNDDFGQFLFGFGGGSPRWLNGDFDYNGVVDNDDFGWFLTGMAAFNASGNTQLSEAFKSNLATFASANGVPLVLPEPFALAPLLACGLMLRRRR